MMPDVQPRRPADLPAWFPPWASQLADLYFSGTTAAFVLCGNTYDLFRIAADDSSRYGVLAEFLAEQLFGRWSLVLHYDLGRGLRAFAGRDERRLKDMLKYHSSWLLKDFTPLVTGWFGNVSNAGLHIGFTEKFVS